MKILLTGFYPPTPFPDADFLEEIGKALLAEGHEVTVVGPRTSAAQETRPKVIPLATTWGWKEVWKIAKTAMREKADVVALVYVYYLGDGHPAITFLPWMLKKMGYQGKVVTIIENETGFARRRFVPVTAALSVMRRVSSHGAFSEHYGSLLSSDRIVCLSLDHANVVSQRGNVSTENFVTLPPCSTFVMAPFTKESRREGRRLLGACEGDVLITFFGYLRKDKRVEMLIEAADKLRDRKNLKFVIAGAESTLNTGYLDSLKSLTAELDLQDRVIFTGDYPAGSVLGSLWLHGSDICVLPMMGSVNLNSSSLAAALRHGLPTIVTEYMSASNRLDAEHVQAITDTVVDADSFTLSQAIARLVDDMPKQDRLRKAALAAAEDLYAPSAYAKALTDFSSWDFGVQSAKLKSETKEIPLAA
ncbi:MAG TPA: glycosyltransferase family 4 protein [Fimbriimonas sp.]|nr:glycosyltransferase family 4 protein [Fimbriimonas sp.]